MKVPPGLYGVLNEIGVVSMTILYRSKCCSAVSKMMFRRVGCIRRLVLLRLQSTLQGCYFLASVWYVLTKNCLHDTKFVYSVT